MHWLRHSCAVHANRNKVPLNAIQRLLGHNNISTTSRYLVEEDEVFADAMEAFLAPNWTLTDCGVGLVRENAI